MLNRRTQVIIKRELLTRMFSKSFILMTILIPLFMVGLIAFQIFVGTYESDKDTRIKIVAADTEMKLKLVEAFAKLEIVKNKFYHISFDTLGAKSPEAYIADYRKTLLEDKLNGIFIVPTNAVKEKNVMYYSTNPNNGTVFGKVKSSINEVLIDIYFKDKALSENEKNFVRKSLNIESYRITKDSKIQEEGYGSILLSILFTILLFFSLIFIGTNLMRSVVEEKANKIVEIILSSVNASELMVGKIIGAAITGLAQMAIWLIPVFLLITTSWFALPPDLNLKVDLWIVIYYLFNFLIALVTFLGLFAAVGSMFDNDQDTQSGVWPIMILIMVPYFIALGLPQRGDNDLTKITSMLPFTSLIVMPARMAMLNIAWWQVGVSLLVNLLTMLAIFPLAGKIYRVGILATGKKPNYKDLMKWLKYKY